MKKRSRLFLILITLIIAILIFTIFLLGRLFLTYHEQAPSGLWTILGVGIVMDIILILFLGNKIKNRYTKPIEAATEVALELAKGNYRARTYVDQQNETSLLSHSINILARNFEEIVKNQEMQQDRLSTLIENMGSALILIDNRGYISLINKTYKEVFDVSPESYMSQLYYNVIQYKEITNLIEEIFMTEQNIKRTLLLPIGIERRFFDVFGSPIIGTQNEWKGVLLVFHDITELKKLEQMRKDFVANVSHELKTPITSIKGFSETLLDGAMKDQDTLESFLSIILKESDRLQTLIQDLLDLSRIEQHDFQLELEEIDILSLLEEVKTMLVGRAIQKNISLQIISKTSPHFVKGDYYRLKQVFINLLSNAINYTGSQGNVEMGVNADGDRVYIHVKDTGIGIQQDEVSRIFERFYRVDRARSRNSGGTGLGLAIVKHIVEAHKGTISVKSVVGKGSTFTISLEKVTALDNLQ
ncbi:two-component system histidine kinase PnpS [Pseudoneobacillus sp. C159]